MSHKVLSKAPDTHSGSHVSHTGLGSMMTTGDVLGYLRVGPRTVYRLIQSEALPALRVGRQWRFRRVDVDDWLERHRRSLGQ